MAAIFGETKIYLKIGMATLQSYPLGENFIEIALSSPVFEIQAFLYFVIFAKKKSKIQNGRHFWRDKNVWKIQMATLQTPSGSKTLSKSLYLIRFSRHKQFFFYFCTKFKNSKWLPFLARQKYLNTLNGFSTEVACRSKISSKLLYLTRFSSDKRFCVLQFLWREKIVLKNVLVKLHRYSVGQKFNEIALSRTVFEI